MSLDAWLATQPGRCAGCGCHVRTQGCRCVPVAPTDEWAVFKAALKAAVRADGTVHQADVRPRIRGRIAPKHIGQLWRRARSEGLVRDTGEREPSNDVAGRNADKLDRIYALRVAA
jgi:hypothetical protein